jgi:hypothetical protein
MRFATCNGEASYSVIFFLTDHEINFDILDFLGTLEHGSISKVRMDFKIFMESQRRDDWRKGGLYDISTGVSGIDGFVGNDLWLRHFGSWKASISI